MGLPRVTISVTALSRALLNVMNLPFISGFISSSIDTAVAEYVAPKSLTLDLQKLISGDDVKKDTDAIGVLVVHIHRATGVKRMDASGGSGTSLLLLHAHHIETTVVTSPSDCSRSLSHLDLLPT